MFRFLYVAYSFLEFHPRTYQTQNALRAPLPGSTCLLLKVRIRTYLKVGSGLNAESMFYLKRKNRYNRWIYSVCGNATKFPLAGTLPRKENQWQVPAWRVVFSFPGKASQETSLSGMGALLSSCSCSCRKACFIAMLRCLFDSGTGIRNRFIPDPGSQTHIFKALWQFFG